MARKRVIERMGAVVEEVRNFSGVDVIVIRDGETSVGVMYGRGVVEVVLRIIDWVVWAPLNNETRLLEVGSSLMKRNRLDSSVRHGQHRPR